MKPLNFVFGRLSDWHLRLPSLRLPHLSAKLLGPLLIAVTSVLSWPAFSGAQGDGNVALGLWVGSVAIMLMAWSFVLAVRPKWFEPLFGGLDSMYRSHRWAGALSIAAMWLHTSIEPDIDGGIRGAARSVADSAEDLAGTGQTMLYILVGLSIFRIVPYRWWRLTHKLLGIPFAFACWHFYTAEKTYANGSAWGWWFGIWMLLGLAAFVLRVIGIDMVGRGRAYKIIAADHTETMTRLELAPTGKPLGQKAGQFAFVKLDVPGMREPHPFTIASVPDNPNLEFMIRHLGDWSSRLPETDLVGSTVRVEGPYGEFEPFGPSGTSAVWIAGGVGCTPFLAAAYLNHEPGTPRPTMLYAVRSADQNPMVDRLRQAEAEGLLNLHLFTNETGRMTPAALDDLFPDGLAGHHVALCGPAGLVHDMSAAAARLNASHIETEDFDIRQGFGPDRSQEIDTAVRQLARR